MDRYLITSALPYINGMKHLGNLVGSMLPADVYARYLRQEGKDVLFICATDEHGTPAEIAAREEGLGVREYCDIQHARQAEVYRRFGLSFDHFGRSSSPENRELTQHFYKRLEENGFIEERVIQQVYSKDDGRFLPDRYVVGTCPKCGYAAARGDQCENCTALLDPKDLVEPRSAISGSANLELTDTRHLFLRLDTLSDRVRDWVNSHEDWPKLTVSVAMKWLDEGLKPRCITRDLEWGVPVPKEGYEGKVFYVWFDAPIEYIGATREWANRVTGRDWRHWWFDASDVKYAQFMAKDNLPFHTVMWPATILGTGEPWTMATYIKGVNWLTYYGGKFSTSQKRGVFMDQALDEFPADYWRYFLLSMAPESQDSDFTWELFAATVNKDLAGNLGNFVNRTLKFCASRMGDSVPQGGSVGDMEMKLQSDLKDALDDYASSLEKMEFRKAISALRAAWSLGNVYIDSRAPWNLVRENRQEAEMVVRTCINLVKVYGIVAGPVIPFTASAIMDAVGADPSERKISIREAWTLLLSPGGRPFKVPDPLFAKIDSERVSRLADKYGGQQS